MRLYKFIHEAKKWELEDIKTSHSVNNILFSTGRPVTFQYLKNTKKAPNLGSSFQQDIEPHGNYMLFNEYPDTIEPMPGWISGEITFKNPLVIKFNIKDNRSYDEFSWKNILSKIYSAKGKRLSSKLKKDGYDGIVTVGKNEIKEIIAL